MTTKPATTEVLICMRCDHTITWEEYRALPEDKACPKCGRSDVTDEERRKFDAEHPTKWTIENP